MQIKKEQLEPSNMNNWQVPNGERSMTGLYIVTLFIQLTCGEYIIWNDRLDEAQAGIKISGGNINNFRYADDTTLMAESEGELKSLLMRVKEESEEPGLKLSIKKTKVPSLHGK